MTSAPPDSCVLWRFCLACMYYCRKNHRAGLPANLIEDHMTLPSALPLDAVPADDPAPQPPVEPPLEACCTSGCNPCIFDTYAEELQQYRRDLQAWQARQQERKENQP